MNIDELYKTSAAAELAWSNELRRLWGTQAGKARFDERGTSTPHLRQLHECFRAAQSVYMEALAADREPLPRSEVRKAA